jgi:molecular chaperone GrpE
MVNSSEEEFVPEEDPSRLDVDEAEADEGPALIKRLREKLSKAVAEKQEYLEGWQRSRADFANYKKEEASLQSHKGQRIKAEFVETILPALDSFEMALKHSKSDEYALVHKQLLSSLKQLGVERFGESGEPYDHYKHEALAQQGDGESVVSVERSGYKIGDTIIRPAQVII